MVLLRKKLGWKRAGYRPWNVNLERVGRERLSPRILREVQRANALDIELYEAARKRLVRETRFCKGFEKELERQQSANRAYRKNERENIDCGQTRQLENKRDKNVAEIYELAEYHYRSGALDKALLWFKGLLRKRDVPPHLEFGARILVSEILEKRGDPSWRRWLRRALARFQNEKPATELRMYRVGSAYRKLGDPEKAGMWFSRLVESKPWNAPIVSGAYFHLGEMRLESGDPAGALECFERCLDYNPRHEKAGILKKTLSGFGGQGRRNRER
jgi:tetratricopeptide (TPR) repeat protein